MRVDFFIPIEKFDLQKRTVGGPATTDIKDRQGDSIPLEVATAAFQEAAPILGIREMHLPKAIGRLDDWYPIPERKAVWADVYLSQSRDGEDALIKVNEGVLKGFSIGGKCDAWHYEGDTRVIDKLTLVELSLVDVPANPEAVISIVKLDTVEDEHAADDTEKAAIPRKEGAPQTAPHGKPKGQNVANYADPANYAFPLDSKARVRSAMAYYNAGRGKDKYSPEEWATIGKRIASKAQELFQADYELNGLNIQRVVAKNVKEIESMSDIKKGLGEALQQVAALLDDGSPDAVEQAHMALLAIAGTCTSSDTDTDTSTGSTSTPSTDITASATPSTSTPSTSTGSTPSTSTGSTPSTSTDSTGHSATTSTGPTGTSTTVTTKGAGVEKAAEPSAPAGFQGDTDRIVAALENLSAQFASFREAPAFNPTLPGSVVSKVVAGDIPPTAPAPVNPVIEHLLAGNMFKAFEAAGSLENAQTIVQKTILDELKAAGTSFRPMSVPIPTSTIQA